MPQKQNIVEIELNGGRKSRGIATGNNAAWLCVCGRSEPLLGRSGSLSGVSDGTRVECPNPKCKRKYFVVPNGKNQGAVLKVVEIY
jgi:hypothetical protein